MSLGPRARLRQFLTHCNRVICGRKKLPFAGYSIVKERLKLPRYQRAAASLVARRFRDELLSKSISGAQAGLPTVARPRTVVSPPPRCATVGNLRGHLLAKVGEYRAR